jgi:hypothetical protein
MDQYTTSTFQQRYPEHQYTSTYNNYGDVQQPARAAPVDDDKYHHKSGANSTHSLLTQAKRSLGQPNFLRKNKGHMIAYCGLALLVLSVYHLLSDGDFSFMLTLGGITRSVGFAHLAFNIVRSRSAAGISLQTLQLYAVTFAARLCSVLTSDGYLPYDASGDWFYQANEVVGFLLVLLNIYLVSTAFKGSYEPQHDSFGVSAMFPAVGRHGALAFLAAPALALALVFHPSLNNFLPTDIAWAVALYLESVAVIPQLFHFQRKGGEIQSSTAHYVFTFGLSRLFIFAFWVSSAHELNDSAAQGVHAGWTGSVVLLMQVVHLVLMGDYSYYYAKALMHSIKTGAAMVLPTTSMV